MNDLNLLVSHALSAVRDAQQSVRDGDTGAGDEAPPLLANFADVMQGLIALAQTAPQTEDAFDYAKTALLQKLAKDKADGEGLPIDVSADQEVENEDGAAEILLEENEPPEVVAQSPLAAAFAPMQETIASLLMAHASDASQAGADAGGPVVNHVMQAAGRAPQPIRADAQPQANPANVEDAVDARQSQSPTDAASQAAGAAQQMLDAKDALTPQAPAPQQATDNLEGAQSAQQSPSQAQAHDAPIAAPSSAEQSVVPQATPADHASVALAAAESPSQSKASPSDRVDLSAQPAPTSQDLTQAQKQPDIATTPAAPLPQGGGAHPAPAAPLATEAVAPALTPSANVEADTSDAADPDPARAGAVEMASAPKAASVRLKTDGNRTQAAAASHATSSGQGHVRPSTTIAERQAARHMQNYQQAMSDQAAATAAPAVAAPAAPATASMVTNFVPAAAPQAMAPTDATAPHTVQLPATALPDLPADLSNALAAGAKRVRIEINPPSLGNVEVGVHMRDGAVFVSMQAENANVAQHIERHLQDLRAHLKDAGLSLGGFEMSARGDEANQQAPHSGSSSQERLWSDDMLKIATDNSTALPIEEISTPVVPTLRPGSINVVA